MNKKICHLEDLSPEKFVLFVENFLKGNYKVSEKFDGSCRLEFGIENNELWTRTKYGNKVFSSCDYQESALSSAARHAHNALESKKDKIIEFWPENTESIFVEVLFTQVPNTIKYGPNVIVPHSERYNDFVKKVGNFKHSSELYNFAFDCKVLIDNVIFKDIDLSLYEKDLYSLYSDIFSTNKNKDKKAVFKNTIQRQISSLFVQKLYSIKSRYGKEYGNIEGVVVEFGDDIVKIVDKEYFTKLNSFFWHYREMLEKGSYVDGVWKPGIMQDLKNRFADSVMHIPVLKTPSAVNILYNFCKDYKDLDHGLISFIYNNNKLFDFYKCKPIINSIFSDFYSLKDEWKDKKSQTIMLNCNNKLQYFGIPEIINFKTEIFFDYIEEQLYDIKIRLYEIEYLPSDQKHLEFLKMFLSHKYIKLKGMMENKNERNI